MLSGTMNDDDDSNPQSIAWCNEEGEVIAQRGSVSHLLSDRTANKTSKVTFHATLFTVTGDINLKKIIWFLMNWKYHPRKATRN